jgi:hypothetical protein
MSTVRSGDILNDWQVLHKWAHKMPRAQKETAGSQLALRLKELCEPAAVLLLLINITTVARSPLPAGRSDGR